MDKSAALAIGLQDNARAVLRSVQPTFELTEAHETSEAVALLRERRFKAIFVDAEAPGFTPTAFDQLRVAAPQTPKALVGPSSHASRFEMLAVSAQFSFLPTDLPKPLFASAARKLLFPRAIDRVSMRVEGFRCRATVDDRQFDHELLDLSNSGLSFGVQPGETLDSFLPGASIRELQIFDIDGQTLLGPVDATVRHCKTERTERGPLVRVGLSFDTPAPTRAPHVRTISDPLPILSSLRKTAKAHAHFTVALPDSESGYRFAAGDVVLEPQPTLKLEGIVPAEFHVYDVVRLTFSHHGQSYSGLTTIIDTSDGLRLAAPRSMRVHHRRGSNRHRPTDGRDYRVRLVSPLTRRDLEFSIYDLNVTGLSVVIDRNVDLLPPGLILDPIEISLPDGGAPVHARGIVRAVTALAREPSETGSPARCGIELLPLPEEERTRLSECLLGDGFPHVETASPADFDDIWQFLKDAGFTFHLYRDETPKSIETVRSGFGHLLGPGRPLAASLIFRDDGKIRGHISGLLLYSKTLMLTHLAALQGKAAPVDRISRALCMGIIEYAEQQPNIEFVKLNWNRDSPWPNRMFGWSGRAIHQPGLSDAREFAVMVRKNDAPPADVPGVSVRAAQTADLLRIERYLVEHANLVRLQSEDLSFASLELSQVNERYQQCGMFRRRFIHVAELDGEPAGFAFIERTTQGVQLAEATNAFDTYVFPEVPEEDQARVRAALIADAIAFYTREGLSHSVSLTEDADHTPFIEAGFRVASISRSWLWHRSQFRSWTDVWDQLFVRGKEIFGARMGQ